MAKGSGTTRTGSARNPRGLSSSVGGNRNYYENDQEVIRAIDRAYGFESDGDFVNWPALQSVGGDTREVSNMIDDFTDYIVLSESRNSVDVGYGRGVYSGSVDFDVVHRSVRDDDVAANTEKLRVDGSTKWSDIFRKLGYATSKKK